MEDPSIDECFRLLRLRRGADFSAVKQAYRTNLYKCHPDRFQGKPDLLPVAERKTKRLNQIYSILESWYLQNAGVDPGSQTGTESGPAGGEPPDEPPFDGDDPPDTYRLRFGITVAVGVAVVAAAAWFLISSPLQKNVPATAEMGEAPAIRPVQAGPQSPMPPPQQLQDPTKAGLAAMIAERDRIKSEWSLAYMRESENRMQAASKELAEAQAQYGRDVEAKAPEIKDAQDEMDRQLDQWRRDSAAAKDLFSRQEQAFLSSLKLDYDAWLLAQGKDAVSKIEGLRKRENSEIGVFSDTEDPGKIFEVWTAEEAGSPEINIAAKTGITVMQPEERFFPHFRSNIFLYNPEGQSLVVMMESIVERHGALDREISDRKMTDDDELANWDTRHPPNPPLLTASQRSVITGRDKATDRLSVAKTQMRAASLTVTLPDANRAFDQSPVGKKWSDRITEMQKNVAKIQGPP